MSGAEAVLGLTALGGPEAAGGVALLGSNPVGWTILGLAAVGFAGYGAYKLYNHVMHQEANDEADKRTDPAPAKTGCASCGDADDAEPDAQNPPATPPKPDISRQKQDGHVRGTPQNQNRIKQGKPTSTFDGTKAEADGLTQEAWEKGTPVPDRPGVRDYDFGRPIGKGPNGGSQTKVRVHEDGAGRIHGHPAGPESP